MQEEEVFLYYFWVEVAFVINLPNLLIIEYRHLKYYLIIYLTHSRHLEDLIFVLHQTTNQYQLNELLYPFPPSLTIIITATILHQLLLVVFVFIQIC